MPEQVTNYKCIRCGGPLHFDAKEQKLKCEYCDSTFTNEEIETLYKTANEAAIEQSYESDHADRLQWSAEEAKHMRAYSCPSCSAELLCDENTAATSCPYCGNPTVVPAQFHGALKPDYVIPFKLDKKDAIKALYNFYKGKVFLPNAFTDGAHIEEIKGIYVPFWLYDGTADSDMAYHGTRTNSYTSGRYHVTETKHYKVIRQGEVRFKHVPADASSKMPDEFMDALEPFNYVDMVPFQMSYMPGYLADKYDVTAAENSKRADVRMKNTTLDTIAATAHGYLTLVPEVERVHLSHDRIHYAFFPIWMLTTRWNGESYMFAMNGQTGKMIGDDLPVDRGKFLLYFLGLTLLFGIVLWFLLLR
ncbi:MAG: hypothetical protein J6D29_04030 [Solobacterium sp.]|nr:hypothetical protein [Solobacterium sp.]